MGDLVCLDPWGLVGQDQDRGFLRPLGARSTGPGTDIKQFGIGLAAGIIFDATVIRALLVPSIMRLMGDWNWWLPSWAGRILRLSPDSA